MEQVPKKPENLPNDGADSDKKPFFNRKGIPPTTVSIAGTIGSIVGIRNIDKRWGAIMLATSSFGDLLDGKMARGEIDIEKIINKVIPIITYFFGFFASYLERELFLLATPEVSRVPLTM